MFIRSGLLKRHYSDEILDDAINVSKLCQVGQRALAFLTSFKPVLPLMAIFLNSKDPGQMLQSAQQQVVQCADITGQY